MGYVYSSFYIFRQQTKRRKVQNWMVASITWIQSPNFLLHQFWFVTVVPKYLNCATFSKDLLAIFMSWFCPAFWWQDSNIYLVFSAFTPRSADFGKYFHICFYVCKEICVGHSLNKGYTVRSVLLACCFFTQQGCTSSELVCVVYCMCSWYCWSPPKHFILHHFMLDTQSCNAPL
jgi:hypothetical protein